jgi:hypothetical protein
MIWLRQPECLNRTYAWLTRSPLRRMAYLFAYIALMADLPVLLAAWAKAHRDGVTVELYQWWLRGLIGPAVGAFLLATIFLERRCGRALGAGLSGRRYLGLREGFLPHLISRKVVSSIRLTPEPGPPECLRLTVTMTLTPSWPKKRIRQWFMLVDDLRAVREFERASGLRIEGWEVLGIPEAEAAK